jgi:hypothetical protein
MAAEWPDLARAGNDPGGGETASPQYEAMRSASLMRGPEDAAFGTPFHPGLH